MNKHFILILVLLGLTSCSTKDEAYYLEHPKELQQVLSTCPLKNPNGQLTCTQLEVLGNKINRLGYELQSSPQGFGKTILALQETIVKQELALQQDNKNQTVSAELAQNKQKLKEYLAVVKWLESPEG